MNKKKDINEENKARRKERIRGKKGRRKRKKEKEGRWKNKGRKKRKEKKNETKIKKEKKERKMHTYTYDHNIYIYVVGSNAFHQTLKRLTSQKYFESLMQDAACSHGHCAAWPCCTL